MAFEPIFQPLKFRNLTVKNRIFRSNVVGPVRQLRRLGESDPHQLGSQVRARAAWAPSSPRSCRCTCGAASFRTTR